MQGTLRDWTAVLVFVGPALLLYSMILFVPIIVSSLIFSLNGTLKVFDSIMALTGGRPGTTTMPLTLYMQKVSFTFNDYVYGCTDTHTAMPAGDAADFLPSAKGCHLMQHSAQTSPSSKSNSSAVWLKHLSNAPVTLLAVFVSVYPVFWIFMSSLKGSEEFTGNPMWALPQALHWENHARAWTEGHMSSYFFNSVVTVVPSLVIVILLGVSAAFGIEIMRWRFSNVATLMFLTGIMIPVQIVLPPLFTMYYSSHLLNTHWALILARATNLHPVAAVLVELVGGVIAVPLAELTKFLVLNYWLPG